MKRGRLLGVILLVSLVCLLSLSLVSASWFTDFWNKITGKAVGDIVCPSGMISYWKFENDFTDFFGSNNGVNNGAVFVDAKVNRGLEFDGAGDYVQTPSNELKTANDFTIELWFKADSTWFGKHLIWQGISTQDGWGFNGASTEQEMHISFGNYMESPENNKLIFFLGNDQASDDSGVLNPVYAFSDTTNWHFVTVVVEKMSTNPTAKLYLDAELKSTDTGENDASTARNNWNTNLRIGRPGTPARYFDGKIDEVAIYNRALTVNEIQEHYNSGLGKEYCVKEGCPDTCTSLGYDCGLQSVCGISTNCGSCSSGYTCSNGKCVAVTQNITCTDSDGGLDYYVKGIVTDSINGIYTDECYTLATGEVGIIEKYCENASENEHFYECPYGCEDGACIPESNITCTDSDGDDPFKTGTTIGHWLCPEDKQPIVTERDYCVNDTTVFEYICNKGCDNILAHEIPCFLGCKDGACIIPENVTCTDSDGGLDYYVKGTVTWGSSGIAPDTCFDENRLDEAYCSDDGIGGTIDYTCPYGCSEGVCIGEAPTDIGSFVGCSDLMSFVQNPSDIIVDEVYWKLGYNSTWESSYNSRKNYYASFSSEDTYVSISVDEMNESEKQQLLEQIESLKTYELCSERRIGEQDVYVCLNPWSVAYEEREIGNENPSYSKDVVWISGNRLFEVWAYEYDNYYWDCWDSQSCQERDNYIHQRKQESLIEAFGKLIDNEPSYVWDFYLNWKSEKLIGELVNLCGSDLAFGEDVCSSGWECKLEPIICPPHGTQTQTCSQWCNDKKSVVITQIDCSPGICSGCYVPRWFNSRWSDNVCIPYGTRFKNILGSELVQEEYTEQERLETKYSGDDFKLEIISDQLAVLTLYGRDGTVYNYNLTLGETVKIEIPDWDEEINSLEITTDYIGGDYVDVTIKLVGTREKPITGRAYCNYDGKVYQQKADWSECDNNYECESNQCSGGECIEMIFKAKGLKEMVMKVLCRLANLFDVDEYNSCLLKYLGTSSGAEGGGGGPPAMPA